MWGFASVSKVVRMMVDWALIANIDNCEIFKGCEGGTLRSYPENPPPAN